MLIALANGWINKFDTMSEKLFLASTMMIVGFSLVFIILVIIIIAIQVMSASIKGFPKRKKQDKPSAAPVKKAEPVPVRSDENDELIAAITGAIHAFGDTACVKAPYPGFIIKSVRRI